MGGWGWVGWGGVGRGGGGGVFLLSLSASLLLVPSAPSFNLSLAFMALFCLAASPFACALPWLIEPRCLLHFACVIP